MKRNGLYIFFILFVAGFKLAAQNPSYLQLADLIRAKYPNVDLSNKIIAFQAWSANDPASREANREMNKASYVYQGARLKNGGKGTIVVSCNMDDRMTADIVSQKDGIQNSIIINQSDYSFLSSIKAGNNIVYDNTTSKVYENLAPGTIFNSYNQLITR